MADEKTEPTLAEQAKALKIDLNGSETESEIAALIEAVSSMQSADKDTISVITTAVGATPINGLVAVGTKMDIQVALFSPTWMKPANAKSAKAVKTEMEARAGKTGAE